MILTAMLSRASGSRPANCHPTAAAHDTPQPRRYAKWFDIVCRVTRARSARSAGSDGPCLKLSRTVVRVGSDKA